MKLGNCCLEVAVTNQDAISFYQHMGFQVTETVKNYYKDGTDAYRMTMSL
jgi:ribosomal-protein-alanine N-acetyltransferase